MVQYNIHDVADRLRRRAAGEWDTLEGVWADGDTVSWHNHNQEETHCTGAQRELRQRAELESFARSIPGLTREATYHVCEETDTIFGLETWQGRFQGREHHVPVVTVYTLRDGRLYRVDEYSDSAQVQPLIEALFAGGWEKNSALWSAQAG